MRYSVSAEIPQIVQIDLGTATGEFCTKKRPSATGRDPWVAGPPVVGCAHSSSLASWIVSLTRASASLTRKRVRPMTCVETGGLFHIGRSEERRVGKECVP